MTRTAKTAKDRLRHQLRQAQVFIGTLSPTRTPRHSARDVMHFERIGQSPSVYMDATGVFESFGAAYDIDPDVMAQLQLRHDFDLSDDEPDMIVV